MLGPSCFYQSYLLYLNVNNMKKHFYEKNSEFIEHPINKTFDEVLVMSDSQFEDWIINMRKVVQDLWDNKGLPPRVGYNEEEITEQFKKLREFSFTEENFIESDALTPNIKNKVIRNTTNLGNAANQWFPTMMKTRIAYSKNEGRSIYDHFVKDELLKKCLTYGARHFKRDSFYHYSYPVKALKNPIKPADSKKYLFAASTGVEWIKKFNENRHAYGEYDYWLQAKEDEQEYTGYNVELKNSKWLTVNQDDVDSFGDQIPDHCKTNLVDGKYNQVKGKNYQIRIYKKGQKIFPLGFKAFRISWCQYAVNFPPLTAKYLYEKYTKDIKKDNDEPVYIWDPSAGWGGRILGAMSIKSDKKYVYIGTDPNTDHNIENSRTKYHDLADFCNRIYFSGNSASLSKLLGLKKHDYEIYQCGSEDMSKQEAFQKYKGKIDLVFTSPPYFCKEIYSDDAEQSCHKFKAYSEWRDGFLTPTLKTAADWLSKDGVILWNIADIKLGGETLPLEEDSQKILNSLGFELVDTLKMSLAQMPGGNRIDPDTGEPLAKNFLKIVSEKKKAGKPIFTEDGDVDYSSDKEMWFKYEPIFVFKRKICS